MNDVVVVVIVGVNVSVIDSLFSHDYAFVSDFRWKGRVIRVIIQWAFRAVKNAVVITVAAHVAIVVAVAVDVVIVVAVDLRKD